MYTYKNITKPLAILAISTLASTSSYADYTNSDSKIAIGAKIGTAGLGVEGRAPVMENLYARLGVNYFTYSQKRSKNADTLNDKTKLTLLTIPLMLDYHPIDGSGFRLSAGLAYNGNKVEATYTNNRVITLYGHAYTPQELGKVKSTLEFSNKIAPVISIGYDSSFTSDNSISFNAEAGVMYAGKAKVKVSSNGLAANNQQKMQDLQRDANKSLNMIKNYLKFLPIVSIGFKFNF